MRQVDYAQAKREWQMELLGCGKLLKQTLMGSSRPNRKSWRVETPQQGSWRASTSLWSWVPKLHIERRLWKECLAEHLDLKIVWRSDAEFVLVTVSDC